jgi:hypothetical protein
VTQIAEKTPAVLAGIEIAQAFLSREGIEKGRENTQQNFNFRGIDDVLNTLSTALVQAKLCIIPTLERFTLTHFSVEKTRGGSSYTQTTYVCELELAYTITSLVDGSSLVARVPAMAFDQSDKAANKALSAAYKYMAIQSFCIPIEGLPDQDSDAITVDQGQPQSLPQLPLAEAQEEVSEEVRQLEDSLRGAATLDDLAKAFKVAYRYAKNRKDDALEASFTQLKDQRKALLEDAAPAEEARS